MYIYTNISVHAYIRTLFVHVCTIYPWKSIDWSDCGGWWLLTSKTQVNRVVWDPPPRQVTAEDFVGKDFQSKTFCR